MKLHAELGYVELLNAIILTSIKNSISIFMQTNISNQPTLHARESEKQNVDGKKTLLSTKVTFKHYA